MDELRDRMTGGLDGDGPPPDLGPLWARGRAARRRSRLLRGAAAAVAVVAMVGGGVALARSADDRQGVVAGPGGTSEPPAEPTDGPVHVRVVGEGAADADGSPVVVADEPFQVEVEADDGWMRGLAYEWQAWDGSGWSTTHTLVAALSGRDAEVFARGDDVFVPAAGVIGSGSARLRAPEVGPGWYRVCTESTGPREDEPSTTTAPDGSVPASSEVTGPPESEARGEPAPTVVACGQARILDEDATTTTASSGPESEPTDPFDQGSDAAPPPEPTDGPVALAVTSTPSGDPAVVHAAAFFSVGFDVRDGDPGSWTRGIGASWEAWDGERWAPTHDLTVAWGEPEREPTADPTDPERAYEGIGFDLVAPARFIAPPPEEAPTGWYRVCVALLGPPGDVRPCIQARVDNSVVGTNEGPVPPTTPVTSPTSSGD